MDTHHNLIEHNYLIVYQQTNQVRNQHRHVKKVDLLNEYDGEWSSAVFDSDKSGDVPKLMK